MAELPSDITHWIEEVTGARFMGARQATAGGRDGYFVDISKNGHSIPLFLQLTRASSPIGTFNIPIEREAEVIRALASSGIPLPTVWGVNAALQALLVSRVKGRTWMHPPASPEEQLSVAQDFIHHLARWHRLDPNDLDLPSFKPVRSAREHQRQTVRDLRARAEAEGRPLEPILRISLEFLEKKLPDYEGPTVLVQGDTGPGNFMFENGRVTGVVDWELAHLGDPMDDIAWLTWRTTQHTFTHLPDRLREYEQLSGHKIDDGRVAYYRVNACVRLAASGSGAWGGFGLPGMGVPAPRPQESVKPVTADFDRGADGSAFVFTILHRRMRLDALMAALGMATPKTPEIEEAPLKAHGAMYEAALANLQTAVSRVENKAAANLIKGVARSIKFLKEADRNGDLFDRYEQDDIGQMLGKRPASLDEGRRALYAAAVERKIGDEDYILYHWRRLLRDEILMRDAAGSLRGRSWPPLH